MGWVVYNTASGRAEKYYRKEAVARAQATRLNRDPYRSKYEQGQFVVIAYAAYEGVLMGLQGENLRFWAWTNHLR
jgi:hypothetical protein